MVLVENYGTDFTSNSKEIKTKMCKAIADEDERKKFYDLSKQEME